MLSTHPTKLPLAHGPETQAASARPQFIVLLTLLMMSLATRSSTQAIHVLDLESTGRDQSIVVDLDSTGRLAGELYFPAGHDDGRELWKSDGTTVGTVPVGDLLPGIEGVAPRDLTRINDVIFFSASTPSTGRELWWTDGTAEGTELLLDVEGAFGSEPKGLTAPAARDATLVRLSAGICAVWWCCFAAGDAVPSLRRSGAAGRRKPPRPLGSAGVGPPASLRTLDDGRPSPSRTTPCMRAHGDQTQPRGSCIMGC